MYQHPGVYVEHVPSGLLAVEAAATAVAAFVGHIRRGVHNTPVFINSATQYAQLFGKPGIGKGGIYDLGQVPDHFGHAINAFFGNGGSKAYIVPVGSGGSKAIAALVDPADNAQAIVFEATSPGIWANGLEIRIKTRVPADLSLGYVLEFGKTSATNKFEIYESFAPVSFDPNRSDFFGNKLKTGSSIATATLAAITALPPAVTQTKALRGGSLAALPLPITAPLALKIQIDGAVAITIALAGNEPTLAAIASRIQSEVRNGAADGSARAGFLVSLTRNSELFLMSGSSGLASAVTVEDSTGRDPLGLAAVKSAVISYPAEVIATDAFSETTFASGTDMTAPDKTKYEEAFILLRDYRDITIMLLPGETWSGVTNDKIDAAITHAEFMQNRMVILDPGKNVVLSDPSKVKAEGYPTSPYAALYYPWLEVTNVHYDPDTAGSLPQTFLVPPAAFAAGLWSRIDATRNVWKAPAGLEATVRGARGPTLIIGNDQQDNLNSSGVNCIRSIIGPPVVWGARTLATLAKPEFRYIPVRRTQNMIGESLYRALQAAVFEPNDHRLWSSLRASTTDFMDGLYRSGAFQGEKASEAYYVRCGLSSTMTQGDIDAGIVRLVVGFAPLKPAEFVVVQIQQIVGRTA